MTTIINGSSPSITFSDSTTQTTAGLPLTGGTVTGATNLATSSGNVGIGTASPTQPLHISKPQGAALIQSTTTTNSAYLAFNNGGGTSYVGVDTSTGSVFSSGAYGMTLFNAANSATTFWTNATERMRIDSSGNLLVGISSTGVSLQPNGQAYQTRIWNANSTNIYIDNSSSCGYVFSYGAASYFAATTAASFTVASDYRLKENFAPLTSAIERIKQLKPIKFSYKENNKMSMPWGTDLVDGFLAHEFAEVIPFAVTGEKDAVDENNEIKAQSLDMTKAVPLLVAAIQELNAKVEAQAATIAELQAKAS